MQLSWSHKLYFLANRYVGRSALFDRLVIIFAKYAIFGLVTAVSCQLVLQTGIWTFSTMYLLVKIVGASLTGLAISWLIGWIYPHRRPIVEFPEIKELIVPLSNWKSFPSDHAFFAFLFAEIPWFFSWSSGVCLSGWFLYLSVVYLIVAVLIAAARVFAGVHYPRDIVGGTILATVIVFIFFH